MKNSDSVVVLVALILLIIVICTFVPLVGIWSLNTLFGLGIPYTFKTCLASLILLGLFTTSASKAKK